MEDQPFFIGLSYYLSVKAQNYIVNNSPLPENITCSDMSLKINFPPELIAVRVVHNIIYPVTKQQGS
jgi:hypothetical protein